MKLKKLVLLGFIFINGLINAQTDFRPGFIIRAEGDTIFGEIDYRGDLLMGEVCRFRLSERSYAVEFSPNDIIAYRFTDSKFYISKKVNGSKVFLEFLINGQVNIYYLREEKGDHYFLEKEGEKLTELPYEEGVRYKKDGTSYIYKSKQHIGILNIYMQDAPDFQSRIAGIGKPEHESLIKLAKDYHNKVCEGEKCVIYQRKLLFVKVNFGIVGGIINYANLEDLNDKYYIQSGVLIHFSMPRTNEKMYLKTGLLVSNVEKLNGDKYRYIRVPVHLGYLAPKTYKVRPFVSIGLFSPSYTGGLMIKLYKKLNIGLQANVNFFSGKFPLAPKELYNYSILTNIYIGL